MAKVDTSMIDSFAFYSLYTAPTGRPSRDRNNGIEHHGSCPWCGGNDRFAFWESGRFSCAIRSSGCGRYGGDVIDFLTQYEGVSFHEACDRLGVDPGSEYLRPVDALTWLEGYSEPPNNKWQGMALALVHVAHQRLYAPCGADALAYLHGRGMTDETIQRARLGYIPVNADTGRWVETSLEDWGLSPEDYKEGKKVKLYEGILIPWYEGETIWKLNVRRLTGLRKEDSRYMPILGSDESLYNIDAIQVGKPVIMGEGELDALSATQALDNSLAVVATGSASHGRTLRAITRLRQASCILVAFDIDEPDKNGVRAGDRGAEYWTRNLPNAARAYPWAHDINDMLIAGMDIHAWATNELEGYDLLQAESQPSPAGDPPVSIVQDAPLVDPADPGQVDDPIHPAIRAAMRLCQQGIIFRLEDDCLVVYYRPAVAEEVERLYEHGGVLTDWVRSIRQKETGYAEATAFYEQFCAQPGYGLRLREDNKVGVTVPESVSDADFERIVDAVCAQGDELKQVLKQRTEEKRKQEPALTCCRCASPVEHYSPCGHAYCTACYRCAGCNQVPRWVYDPERDLQVCACVMEASHRVTRYTPYTLSAFSRTNCPHHVITLKDNRFRSTSCKGKTLEHGWCADHAYAHELLCLGAALGYPAVHGDYRHIEQRVENWEVYAECVSAQHAAGDVASIRTHYRYHEPLDLSVPVVQKTTQPPHWAQSSVYTSVLATRSKVDLTSSMEVLV